MPALHEPEYRAAIMRRLRALRPDAQRRWGTMSAAQMLWHVNQAMEGALGRPAPEREKVLLPRPVMKFIVINMPWPKGAPTLKRWVPQSDSYDFAGEHDRCCRLVEELASKPLGDAWPDSPLLGRMRGSDVSRLHAKHLNHHLKQFGL
jgi:hypothetical protein